MNLTPKQMRQAKDMFRKQAEEKKREKRATAALQMYFKKKEAERAALKEPVKQALRGHCITPTTVNLLRKLKQFESGWFDEANVVAGILRLLPHFDSGNKAGARREITKLLAEKINVKKIFDANDINWLITA